MSEVVLIQQPNSSIHKIVVDDEPIGQVDYYQESETIINLGSDTMYVRPESYNIGVSLIQKTNRQIIGMTKKYDLNHIIGIDDRVFKLEIIGKGSNQYKLMELQDGKDKTNIFPKRIFIKDGKSSMEIFHNLNDIPATALPLMVHTKQINKKISNKLTTSLLLSALLLATRIIILKN